MKRMKDTDGAFMVCQAQPEALNVAQATRVSLSGAEAEKTAGGRLRNRLNAALQGPAAARKYASGAPGEQELGRLALSFEKVPPLGGGSELGGTQVRPEAALGVQMSESGREGGCRDNVGKRNEPWRPPHLSGRHKKEGNLGAWVA